MSFKEEKSHCPTSNIHRQKSTDRRKSLQNTQLRAQLFIYKLSLLFEIFNPSEETKSKKWYKMYEEIYLSSSMPKTQKFLYDKGFVDQQPLYFVLLCIDVILRGIAQVFLCNHPLCGILVLIGLGFTSFKLPLYALLGTALSTFSAVVVARPPEADILAGLCGYDGALVGCACLTFFGGVEETITRTILLSFLAGIVHVAVTNLMKIWQLPSFTFAFNIVTVMMLFAVKGEAVKLRFVKSVPLTYAADWTDMSLMFVVDASIRGVGQFMFADTTIGSSFVVAGIALCSRKGASIAVLGAMIGWIVAYYVLDATNRVNIRSGLYGYNCAGTCCVLAGGIFYPASDGAVLVGICGAALAALLHQGIAGMFDGLPVLTFPFIVSAWILMLCRSKWLDVESDGILRPLMKRMSTGKLPAFGIKYKPHPGSRTTSNADPLSRLRSHIQSITSSNKIARRQSSAKIAVLPPLPQETAGSVNGDDIESASADGKSAERDQVLYANQSSSAKFTGSAKTPISFKNIAHALVDVQREIREEQVGEQFRMDDVKEFDEVIEPH
jgi:urea transporter